MPNPEDSSIRSLEELYANHVCFLFKRHNGRAFSAPFLSEVEVEAIKTFEQEGFMSHEITEIIPDFKSRCISWLKQKYETDRIVSLKRVELGKLRLADMLLVSRAANPQILAS